MHLEFDSIKTVGGFLLNLDVEILDDEEGNDISVIGMNGNY